MAKKEELLPQKNKKQEVSLNAVDYRVGMEFIRDGHFYKIIKITKKEIELDGYYETTVTPKKLAEDYTLLKKPKEEYEKELLSELSSDFASYRDSTSDSTDMVLSNGKAQALQAREALNDMTQKMDVFRALMESKMNEMREIASGFKDQLKSINRVLDIIELYLGIHEEITQIKEGNPAIVTDLICFRQLVLHMDEEVAATDDGGLDFKDVGIFDEWLIENIDSILPESKGVVVVRPRRDDKSYKEDDPFAFEKNQNNKESHIVIRNGENIYRITSDNIRIYPHLFPSPKEMDYISDPDNRSDAEINKNKVLGYKRNVLMLQGLLERTDIFRPHDQGINLFNPETYDGKIRFIYDAGGLTDGRISFTEWQVKLNKQLKLGDRIYFTRYPYDLFRDKYDNEESFRMPVKTRAHRPGAGVYNIKKELMQSRYYNSKPEKVFYCQYKPDDEIYDSDYRPHARKNSIPFVVTPEDDFIINYELISIEDIDYYLADRVNRQYYLSMMPVLKGIRTMLLEEKRWEEGFVSLIKSKVSASDLEIAEAITWWKNKVIEKRPLTREDSKAVRMIVSRLKKDE